MWNVDSVFPVSGPCLRSETVCALTSEQRKASNHTQYKYYHSFIHGAIQEETLGLSGWFSHGESKVSQHWFSLTLPHTVSRPRLTQNLFSVFQARVNEFKEKEEQPMEWRASHTFVHEAVKTQTQTVKMLICFSIYKNLLRIVQSCHIQTFV